jgi:hypothetical protein
MNDDISGFYNDDGTKINTEFIPKPSLCVACKKNRAEEEEEILCILTRIDQKDSIDFECDAYEPIFSNNVK